MGRATAGAAAAPSTIPRQLYPQKRNSEMKQSAQGQRAGLSTFAMRIACLACQESRARPQEKGQIQRTAQRGACPPASSRGP